MNIKKVYMMLGLPGSGKTTKSKEISKELGLPRFSLDEEYFDQVENKQDEKWDFQLEKKVSNQIKQKIIAKLAKGSSVVLDFCPWRKKERKEYLDWLKEVDADPVIYYFNVSKGELNKRLRQRNLEKNNQLQYVTPEMLDDFYQRFDPPTKGEAHIIEVM